VCVVLDWFCAGTYLDVKVGDDAEAGGRAADGEEDILVLVVGRSDDGAIGQDDFSVNDVVTGGAELS
jgi:hypothetical protein